MLELTLFHVSKRVLKGTSWRPSHRCKPWWRHQMETFPRYWPFVWGIHRSTLITKTSDAELWYFLLSAPEQTVEQTTDRPVIWDAIAFIMTSLITEKELSFWRNFLNCLHRTFDILAFPQNHIPISLCTYTCLRAHHISRVGNKSWRNLKVLFPYGLYLKSLECLLLLNHVR